MARKKLTEKNKLDLLPLDQALKRATEKKASDLHLKVGLPAIIRVNGSLYYLGDQNSTAKDNFMERLSYEKFMTYVDALLDEKQRKNFEDGVEIDLGYECLGVRFRLHICKERNNPRMICRYIPENIPTLESLGHPSTINRFCELSRGLVLVTGATGSGKTTTLVSLVDTIARNRSCHIVTIEDPIEFVFKDKKSIVTQREIGHDTLSFSKALKYALRQDPDVILVGELREEESILMALSAAETGHLVLSSLHTNDAAETIYRILGNVNPSVQEVVKQQLANVLMGVVSQRLIPKKDKSGRVPATEVLVHNARVAEIIRNRSVKELHEVIEESYPEMRTFDQSLIELVEDGTISKEEALLNCTNLQDFSLRLNGITKGMGKATVKQGGGEITRLEAVERLYQSDESEIEFELPVTKKTKI